MLLNTKRTPACRMAGNRRASENFSDCGRFKANAKFAQEPYTNTATNKFCI